MKQNPQAVGVSWAGGVAYQLLQEGFGQDDYNPESSRQFFPSSVVTAIQHGSIAGFKQGARIDKASLRALSQKAAQWLARADAAAAAWYALAAAAKCALLTHNAREQADCMARAMSEIAARALQASTLDALDDIVGNLRTGAEIGKKAAAATTTG